MPWDSGPVAMFYRRDFYEKAGVDPATIKTWDDFIAAGKKIMEANPGVTMTQADINGDTEFFRMIANEQGCGYYSKDSQSITVNQPGCVTALEKVKALKDAGLLIAGTWDEKIQANTAGTVATQMYGGWYEGTHPLDLSRSRRQMGRLPDAERHGRRAACGQSRRLLARHHLGLRAQGSRLGLSQLHAGNQ